MNMQKYAVELDTVFALRRQICEAYQSGREAEAFRLSAMIDEIQLRYWAANEAVSQTD